MAAGINTDPESLLKVAQAINTADAEIKAAILKMQSALNSAQWNDPVRQRFNSDFASLLAGLRSFQSNAPATAQYLRTKAEQLKAYNGN